MAFHYNIDTNFPREIIVGKGTVLPFAGWVFDTDDELKEIILYVDYKPYVIENINKYREDVLEFFHNATPFYRILYSGFHTTFTFEEIEKTKEINIDIVFVFDNYSRIEHLSKYTLINENKVKKIKPNARTENKEPSIAICMATYNPDLDAFKVQLDSILNQTHKNWTLIINDDKSSDDKYIGIKTICNNNSQIHVFQNEKNLGFYKNFEKAIERVDTSFDFIAFSDQDDYWYENKLAACVSEMKEDVSLVYSDMRIVNSKREVIHNTYWVKRKNHYDDIRVIITANTVTGAASLFRTSLLEYLLPFPAKIGDIYHDQWLSVVARCAAKINYIDKPLYDYIQHRSNVLGHSDFKRTNVFRSIGIMLWFFYNAIMMLTNIRMNLIKAYVFGHVDIYNCEFKRLVNMVDILNLRFKDKPNEQLALLDVYQERKGVQKKLIKFHLHILKKRYTTNNAELRMLNALFVKSLFDIRYRIFRKVIGNSSKDASSKRKGIFSIIYTLTIKKIILSINDMIAIIKRFIKRKIDEHSILENQLEIKIRPLNVEVDDKQLRRINLLIPELNFDYLFGGYLAKLNFALQLTRNNNNVRIILTDYCKLDIKDAERKLKDYKGLENFFCEVELSLNFDRKIPLLVNPKDTFIATTWWTAHIANDARKKVNKKQFLYFIQEYEPFTFPMGAFYAVARQSYDFPHSAMFSTPFLKEYFEKEKIGVFGDNKEGYAMTRSFENAIQKFTEIIKNKSDEKRLLMYARPEGHATRNMFDLAILALKKAISDGVFDESWTFTGIGSSQFNEMEIELVNGRKLKMMKKVSLNEYQEMLPNYDLGLSLMYTPHPSLLPLELAAAGLVVVTNSCLNKSQTSFNDISSNILVAEPTIDGISEALNKASKLVNDIEFRKRGAIVKWSNDWSQTFGKDLMNDIASYSDAGII